MSPQWTIDDTHAYRSEHDWIDRSHVTEVGPHYFTGRRCYTIIAHLGRKGGYDVDDLGVMLREARAKWGMSPPDEEILALSIEDTRAEIAEIIARTYLQRRYLDVRDGRPHNHFAGFNGCELDGLFKLPNDAYPKALARLANEYRRLYGDADLQELLRQLVRQDRAEIVMQDGRPILRITVDEIKRLLADELREPSVH